MLQVTSTEIHQWADTRSSQSKLPDLIRRLILTTIDYRAIDHIAFPCGDDIGRPGYDGVLTTRESNPYIPIGNSVWEMSTQKGIDQKAESDYLKRTSVEADNETTFIFVTACKWGNKDNWAASKTAEGFWKEVRAYDAIDLESWLLLSSSTNLWFLELLGRYDNNIETLDSYSKHWMSSFEIKLPFETSLTGRGASLTVLHSFLQNGTQTQKIRSITKDESVIFLYAAILALPDEKNRYALLSRALVVKSAESLKHRDIESNTGLLIIPVFKNIQDLGYKDGCRYLIPLDPSNPFDDSAILLSRIDAQTLSKHLEIVGLPESRAGLLAKNSGGFLTILRRLISRVCLPEWAQNDQNRIRRVIPIMLTQNWDTKHTGDSEMISLLAGMNLTDYENHLTQLLNYPDRPINKIGSLWCVNSALDCYLSFISYISRKDWEEYQAVVLKVLTDRNPALDLEPEKRYAAALYDKSWQFSEDFRRGLAQSLVLISIYGEHSCTYPQLNHTQYIDQIIEQVFHNADQALWYSLGDVLPLLAEASPKKFIRAVESSLSSKEKHIMGMFTESGDFITSSSTHHHLLWALEALAWDASYFKRSVTALCVLSQLDPGGRVSNRPFNSLISIFRLWMPQTEVSSDVRFQVLEEISTAHPDIGWNLLVSLLPKSHDTGSYNYRYKWRDLSCPLDIKVTRSEWYESICQIVDLILPQLGTSANRWVELLESYADLPEPCKKSLLEYYNSRISEVEDTEILIADKLRDIVSRHRTYKSSEWAMSEESIKPLEDLYKQFEPTSVVAKFKYLFNDHYPDLIEGRSSMEDDGAYLSQLRLAAVEEMTQEIGFAGIFEFSNIIGFQNLLADAVPLKTITDNLELILTKLESKGRGEMFFSQNLLWKGYKNHGNIWAEAIIAEAIKDKWDSSKLVNLLLSFPSERWLWNLVETTDQEVQREYWKKALVHHHDMLIDDIKYVINRLLNFRRNFSALRLASHAKSELPITDVALVLEMTATTECSEPVDTMVSYYAEKLLERVQASQEIELAAKMKLEWMYISVLTSLSSRIGPKNLHEDMSINPSTFVDVLSMVYKPRCDDPAQKDEDHENEQIDAVGERVAESAFKLLNSWHLIPGKTPEGTIDVSKLKTWIDDVTTLSQQRGFYEVALCKIGNVLSYAAGEADGQWPCNSICEILEYYKDDRIDLNFRIGVHNQRGTTVRGMYDGGKQERTLIEKYKSYASQVVGTYPRVSDILNDIANDFERDAKREDEEAEKNRIKYG